MSTALDRIKGIARAWERRLCCGVLTIGSLRLGHRLLPVNFLQIFFIQNFVILKWLSKLNFVFVSCIKLNRQIRVFDIVVFVNFVNFDIFLAVTDVSDVFLP